AWPPSPLIGFKRRQGVDLGIASAIFLTCLHLKNLFRSLPVEVNYLRLKPKTWEPGKKSP
ncbi:MAG: hypothetical protein LJE94_18845, partial [Deltaproteobacteria bacterium]|nr:hypothetical protein [Deltaproteobacteria bacterium]